MQRKGAVPDSFVQNKMTRIARTKLSGTTPTGKRSCPGNSRTTPTGKQKPKTENKIRTAKIPMAHPRNGQSLADLARPPNCKKVHVH
jgi:hypothetical protein